MKEDLVYILLITFIILFIVWVVKYDNLKKTCNSNSNPQLIDISNITVSSLGEPENIGEGNILYVYDYQINFNSTYVPSTSWSEDVYAYFDSDLVGNKLAIWSTGAVIEEEAGNFYINLKIAQIDGGVGTLSTSLYFILQDDVTNVSSEYQQIVVGNIQCIYEKTLLKLKDGMKCAQDINVNDLMLQPNGKTSKVLKIKKTLIKNKEELLNVLNDFNDHRLFKHKNTIITYWHKIKLNEEMILPKDHSEFNEYTNIENLYVYNFVLENYDDFIITEDDIILESLKPYVDDHNVKHIP